MTIPLESMWVEPGVVSLGAVRDMMLIPEYREAPIHLRKPLFFEAMKASRWYRTTLQKSEGTYLYLDMAVFVELLESQAPHYAFHAVTDAGSLVSNVLYEKLNTMQELGLWPHPPALKGKSVALFRCPSCGVFPCYREAKKFVIHREVLLPCDECLSQIDLKDPFNVNRGNQPESL